MNHFAPRQLVSGKWQYTNKANDRVYPLGYCAQWQEWELFYLEITGLVIEDYKLNDLHKHKHHEDGHDSPEQACKCYREYLLDHAPFYRKHKVEGLAPCDSCKFALTSNEITVNFDDYHLCDKCWNRKGLDSCLRNPD